MVGMARAPRTVATDFEVGLEGIVWKVANSNKQLVPKAIGTMAEDALLAIVRRVSVVLRMATCVHG
jgi:hypothetical protein